MAIIFSYPILTSIVLVLLPPVIYILIKRPSISTAPKSKSKLPHEFGTVLSVSKSPIHDFSKDPLESIALLTALGVEGDSHLGTEVQHLYRRIGPPPYAPNLRQVHLMHSELFTELAVPDEKGESFVVQSGDLGENITTMGIDLLGLSEGAKLRFVNPGEEGGKPAVVSITGLRNPCSQISKFRKGLQERCVVRDENRKIVQRKAGIMGVVEVGGVVRRGARIVVEEPKVWKAMEQV